MLLALALPAMLTSSCVLNLVMNEIERIKYPLPGSFYQVDGQPMHIYCAGQGSPTVVFEAELGDDWLSWQRVQPELTTTTRACTYDRARLGWSRPRKGPRDAVSIARELHLLLHNAGETAPFILVGASAGGLYIRVFTAAYPAEVAGLVFVDSATPEQIQAQPGANDSPAKRAARHRKATWKMIRELTGWQRFWGGCKADVDSSLQQYAGLAGAENCRPAYATSLAGRTG